MLLFFFFFQAEDGIRDAQESRGLGDVYKRQYVDPSEHVYPMQVANGSLENMWLSKDKQT